MSIVISLSQDTNNNATHIAKINNRIYKLDLLDKFIVSSTFNVPNLFLFDVDYNSRRIFLMEKGMMGTIVQVMGTTMQEIQSIKLQGSKLEKWTDLECSYIIWAYLEDITMINILAH